jgi:hypothetical protein
MQFVNIPTSESNSSLLIKQHFDYTFDIIENIKELENKEEDKVKKLENIYNYYKNLDKNNKIITLSPDTNISSGTIAGLNELFMYRESDVLYNSELRIIYFDLETNKNIGYYGKDFIIETQRLGIKTEHITYVGINDDNIFDDNPDLEYYTMKMTKKRGLDKILNKILEKYENSIIHVVINLRVFSCNVMPSVYRENFKDDLFDYKDLETIVEKLKDRIYSLDVVGFNEKIDSKDGSNRASLTTASNIQMIIKKIFNIKEYKLNIFNEETKFLIFRPIIMKSEEDYGWYILRNINKDDTELLISYITHNNIITLTIELEKDFDKVKIEDDEDKENLETEEVDVILTTTTMNEQFEKSYFGCNRIEDMCLFPFEKAMMGFELLNK